MSDSHPIKRRTKFIRELGELAILIQLAKKEEGSHAYELFEDIKEVIFPHQIQQLKDYNVVRKGLSRLITKYPADKIENESDFQKFQKDWEKFRTECSDTPMVNFLLSQMSDAIQLQGVKSLKPLLEMFSTLNKKMEGLAEHLSLKSSIWSNVTNIYPVLASIEKDGLIIGDEIKVDARYRKVYRITDSGYQHLRNSIFDILNIFTFILPSASEKLDPTLFSRFMPRPPSVFRGTQWEELFPKISYDENRLSFLFESDDVPSVFEPWILFMSILIIQNQTGIISRAISKTGASTEGSIHKQFLLRRFRKIQATISAAIQALEEE